MSCEITSPNVLCKDADEKRQFSMEFDELMSEGETIEESSPAPDITFTFTPESADDITVTDIEVDEQTVMFWIEGGSAGATYKVKVEIETSTGQTLVGYGKLRVRNS